FSSRRRHTRLQGDWSSDVCSSDLSALSIDAWNFVCVAIFPPVVQSLTDRNEPSNLILPHVPVIRLERVTLCLISSLRPAPRCLQIGRASCRERVEIYVYAE